jgi:phosphate acetyltransferase
MDRESGTERYSHAAAARAVELVREGRAELLMQGSLHSDELLGAVVARDAESVRSHIANCAVAMLAAHARRKKS